MATAKLAPITMSEGDNEFMRIESDTLFRILYVEDEPDVRGGIEERFQDEGFNIEAVSTPADASELLEPDKYDLLIMDIQFGYPNISGDEFVYKNQVVLENTKKVAFTSHAGDIVHDLFDDVIRKGRNQELMKWATRLYHLKEAEFKSKLIETANNMINGGFLQIGKYQLAEEKIQRLQERLVNELGKVGDKRKTLVTYKGETYTADRLIEEVKLGSEVGNAHIGMMLDLIEA